MAQSDFKYWGFVSYSHRDTPWGDWLHRKLESFRIPLQLRRSFDDDEALTKRLFPIFRDREELPTASDLGVTINDALAQSRSLIVICSPNSARSHWVNEEILTFKRMGRGDRIFCLIVDGEPNASDDPSRIEEECFPEALRYAMDGDGNLTATRSEPIAADARPGKDGKHDALLKLAAGILGVGFDDLKRRDLQRQVRRWIQLSIAAIVLLAVTAGLAVYALRARNEAIRQERIAEANFRKARSAVDRFFIEVSDRELFETHGLQPLQEKLLRNGLEYYEGFLADRSGDLALAADTARTHERVGEISSLIGNREGAVASFQTSGQMIDQLLAKDPSNFQLRLQRAELRDNLSTTLWEMGSPDKALTELIQAKQSLSVLVDEDPKNEDVKLAWEVVSRNLGPFQRESGLIDDARETYLAVWNAENASDPNSLPEPNFFACAAAMNLGVLLLEEESDIGSAIEWLRKAELATRKLLKHAESDDTSNAGSVRLRTLRELLCSITTYLGVSYQSGDDIVKAILSTEGGLDIARELSKRNPAVTSYQEQVANLSENLAVLHDQNQDSESAENLHKIAIAALKRLTVNHPDKLQYQFQLAQTYNNLAIGLVKGQKLDEAVTQYERSLEMLQKVRKNADDPSQIVSQMVNTRRNLGAVKLRLEEYAAAKTTFESARDDANKLVDISVGLKKAAYLGVLESIHQRLFTISENLGDSDSASTNSDAALRCNEQEIAALETASASSKDDAFISRRLAQSLCRYGLSLVNAARFDKATEAFSELNEVYGFARAVDSLEQVDRELIAYANGNLAWLSLLRAEFSTSIQQSEVASKFNPGLDWVETNLATALLCNGEFDKAKTIFTRLKSVSESTSEFRSSLIADFDKLRKANVDTASMDKMISELFDDEE